jgi:hypothetical protein
MLHALCHPLVGQRNELTQAQQAYKDAAVSIHRLAESIDDEGLRDGFLAADLVRAILYV